MVHLARWVGVAVLGALLAAATAEAQLGFGFSMSNSGGVTVTAGGAGATTITATLTSGSTQPVTFSVSGLPAGVSANFSVATCNPTCSTVLTLATSASTPTGDFTITVTGSTFGNFPLVRTTSFTLAVQTPFNYSLAVGSVSPAIVALTAGGPSQSTTVSAALLTGTTQSVAFSLSALPTGVTATFSAPACSPSCSTTLTLAAAPGAPASTTTVTVTGTSVNTPNRTTTFTLVVNPAFNYALAASPANVALTGGGPAQSTTITATLLTGTTQSVAFSLSALPAGVTATFSAPACSPSCSTTLTLAAAPGAPASTTTVTVTGTSVNTPNRTATFTLIVTEGFNYALAASPANVALARGGPAQSTTITATLLTGTTQSVAFSLSALPAGVTATFSAPACSPSCSTTLTLAAAPGAPASTTTVTVTGTSVNTPNRTATFTLIVTEGFNYALAASPANVALARGGPAQSTTITATLLTGTTQSVAFSLSALPAGVTATFSAPACSPSCSTTLTLAAAPGAPASTTTVTVTGTSVNTPNRTATFTLIVSTPFDYALAASPANVALARGGPAQSTTITATLLTGTTQSVAFSLSALPAGVTATFSAPACSPSCSTTLTLAAAPGAPASTTTVTVTGTSVNTPNRTATFTLIVSTPFDYALAASPANVALARGGPAQSTTITATLLTGTTQSVAFSLSALPTGVTATFSAPACSPSCSTTLTLAAAPGAPASTTTVTVTGTSVNTPNRTATFTLIVSTPFDYALAASPANLALARGGPAQSTTITATLLTGTTQSVAFSLSALPTGVTATFSAPACSPSCSTTLTLAAAPGAPASTTTTVTVTGTSFNTPNRTATFTVTVTEGFNYALAASPANVTVTAGGPAATTTVTATLLTGTTQGVSFSLSALPTGITASFSSVTCSPTCSTTLTVTATSATTSGRTFPITVTGTSPNTPNRTATFTLTVNVLRSLTIVAGNNQAGVINAPLPKPLVVSVTPATPAVTVIWEVTGGAIPSATSTPTVNGLAQITLTLGPTPAAITVRASIAGDVTMSVTFVVNDATTATVAGLKTFSVLGNLAVTAATVQAKNIGLRLAALRRGGGSGVSVSGLSVNVAGQTVPLEAMTAVLTSEPGGGASADPGKSFGGLGIFMNGQGTFGDQNGSTLEPGFKFHSEGLTLGTDYRVSENFVLGAAAGYLHTTSTLDEAGGRVKMSGYSVSVFGSYYQADRFYVDAIATYGWNDFGVTRNVTFGDIGATAKSDPDGNQFTLSMSAGYNFNVGALTIGPTARATYINVRIDGFRERGADLFNLRVNSQRVESLASDLGAQLSYAISMPWGVLSPLARAEWEHEFKGGSRLIAGSLVADPLRTVFGAPTNTPDRNYVNLAAGLTATLPRGASAFAHYETVLGRDRVTTHSFTAGVRFQFE